MSAPRDPSEPSLGSRAASAAKVIVVSSVMFTFISYWRTAAIVLCDLGSTAYYIGGIAEQSIGAAAPWFILAVMLFSYAVRSVYIESCSMFVRGGVYRVVKEALGSICARIAVSALMFDYILTGPISAVSAGQYILGLALDLVSHSTGILFDESTKDLVRTGGSMAIAVAITVYFFRQNLLGIHESSDKALKIMIATTIMVVLMLGWCGVTLLLEGPHNRVPLTPEFGGEHVDPLGFISDTGLGDSLRALKPDGFFSLLGLVGLCIAFGHSVLAMSGEETLAQVYREVESPKLKNFKRAAFIVFVYSLILTAGTSFLAVMLIPDDQRLSHYADNLIGGLAMNVCGPIWARLCLNGFVVVVGFLILAGAVNTAIIGSNGVLNRVAEDGVLPAWLRRPHPRYGTTYRMLYLILILQLTTILASRGDVIVLGEAYAFGVVWSFVFMTLAMLVLRFKKTEPREFRMPGNVRIGTIEIPLGLGFVLLVLGAAAIANLATKKTATQWGLGFTAAFLTTFTVTETVRARRRRGQHHAHREQFNKQVADELTVAELGLTKPFRKLVAIRSPHSMYMLQQALAETDPETTELVVLTAKALQHHDDMQHAADLTDAEEHLMTNVVQHAELAGKTVKPLIVPTNNPLYAVLQTARTLKAQEVVLGASNKYTAEEQLDQVALYWLSMHGGEPAPLTVHVLGRHLDLYFDLGGGSRIPKISERQARTVAELRAAGVGVDRVLMVHDGTPECSDLFQAVLTMLDPQVTLTLLHRAAPAAATPAAERPLVLQDQERAQNLRREVEVLNLETPDWGSAVVATAAAGQYDLVIVGLPKQRPAGSDLPWDAATQYILTNASCRVVLAAPSLVPARTDD